MAIPIIINIQKEIMNNSQTRTIEVVPYDHKWPSQFKEVANEIQKTLGDNCIEIHHIGSTAIVGIHAKPIIDVIPVVKDILKVDQFNEAMKKLGYIAKGEHGMPFRRFFQRTSGIAVNVHIFEEDNPEVARNLAFRDQLNRDPADKEAYAILKLQLGLHANDITDYVLKKDPFVQNIFNKIDFKGLRIVQALSEHEWQGYRSIMQDVLFGPIGITFDPQHWTMTAADHYKFVFIEGTKVIGAAMIAFMGEEDCILRTLAIDHYYQNQGFGEKFLKLLIRWAQHQGKKVMYLHSRVDAVRFYKRHGFTDMSFIDPVCEESNKKCIDLGRFL